MRKLLSLAVVSLLLTTSCSDSGRDNTGDTEKPTGSIRVQISGEAEETAVYDAVADTFESDNPGIQVELTKVADKDDHLAKLTTSFAAGDPPDVFLVNYREYAQFVTRGAIEAVEGHLKDAGIDLDLYFPRPLEAFTFDGTLQCMPQNVSSLVVYYNRKLFRQAGVKPPNDGWSFEEFRDIARALGAMTSEPCRSGCRPVRTPSPCTSTSSGGPRRRCPAVNKGTSGSVCIGPDRQVGRGGRYHDGLDTETSGGNI